ncbi:hypothetical protein [Actinophytocola sp.]|uniref:hypothetical protein n=1 Tax=Actinophytocola sp. TaxID=1872138 RepID=UPI00389AECB8
MLPMLREHGIRYLQVARGGQAAEHGYDVLADSLAPTEVVRRGAWHLGQEMDEALTVPRIVTGRRECSARAKGEVLDAAIADEIAAGNIAPGFRHVIAYAAELCCRFVTCPLSTVSRGGRSKSLTFRDR